MVIAGIFIEDQPGIDIGDVARDVDFLSKDENLRKIIYGVVGFVSDIDIAIYREGAIDKHGKSVHELLTGGVTSGDEVATTIELIKIGGAIHGTEASISLVIELGKAEIILRGGFIRGEAGDSIRRISDNGVAEASLETGEDGGADAGDAGITWPIFIVSDSHVADITNTRNY